MTTMTRRTRRKPRFTCDNPKCGRKLKEGHWILGRDLRVTDGVRRPRYCWPGEGCQR